MLKAHGLGGAADLPIPANFAIAGGAAALTISFVVLLLAWRQPRYANPDNGGTPVPAALSNIIDSRWFAVVVRAVGFAFFAYVAAAAIFGPDQIINPTFGVVYVWLWVGIVPASLLFGPFYKAVNPARTIHALVNRAINTDDRPVAVLPNWVGYWPAALGLLAFVWLELVYPNGTYLGPVRLWFALYLAIVIIGGILFGSRWIARADPFEVYSTLVGHLSIWGRTPDGTLVVHSPLRNLARLRGESGLVAVIAVLLGSTAFDSFRESNYWLRYTQSTDLNITLINTLVLVGVCTLVGVTFAAATAATGIDTTSTQRRHLPGTFAHSVVPIIVGYMVAHYLTLFVEFGQQTLIQLSDPFVTGADLLSTANLTVNYWLSGHPTFLATTKVVAIVTGHIVGVIAAHDRALVVLPRRHQVTGQLPLLGVMVLYTFTGLYLLFGA